MPNSGGLSSLGWWPPAALGAATLLVLLAQVRRSEAEAVLPSIEYGSTLGKPVSGKPGELVTLLVPYRILRPECRRSETVPMQVLIDGSSWSPVPVEYAPPTSRMPSQVDQSTDFVQLIIRIPELVPAGDAEVWYVVHRECPKDGTDHVITTPRYPITILPPVDAVPVVEPVL